MITPQSQSDTFQGIQPVYLLSLHIKVGLKRLAQHYMQSWYYGNSPRLLEKDLEKWVVTYATSKALHDVFPELLPSHPFPVPSSSSLLAGQFQTHSVAADVTVFIRMHRDMRGQRHQALQHLGNDVAWVFLWGIAITLREQLGFYNNLRNVSLKQHLFSRDVFYSSYALLCSVTLVR